MKILLVEDPRVADNLLSNKLRFKAHQFGAHTLSNVKEMMILHHFTVVIMVIDSFLIERNEILKYIALQQKESSDTKIVIAITDKKDLSLYSNDYTYVCLRDELINYLNAMFSYI